MSILPFPSFLDDVKEKGFKKAVFEGIDDSVERLTSGLNVQDLREAMRGETASRRPNPRLTPHADGFWLHMRPSYFNRDVTGMYPSPSGWAGLRAYFVWFETITGLLVDAVVYAVAGDRVWRYADDFEQCAAGSADARYAPPGRRIHGGGGGDAYDANLDHGELQEAASSLPGSAGLLLLVITGFLSFSGYLLPWDQLSLWAVTIGASMAEATPVVGDQVNLLLRGAPELGANGLLRFYLLHVLALPALLFVFYRRALLQGGYSRAQPAAAEREYRRRHGQARAAGQARLFHPRHVLTYEMMWLGATTFIITVLCIWFYHAPLENHANPEVTPLGTTAPWYFLWIQGALKLGDKFVWGVAFPTDCAGRLGAAALPWM